MSLSRRQFITGLVSASLFNRLFGAAQGEPLLRFGFLSDAHLGLANDGNNAAFAAALARFAAANVDAVVMSGDLLDTGSEAEMELLLDAWRTAFPTGAAADGRPVTPFPVWGNHDYMDASYMRTMTPEELRTAYPHCMIDDKDRWWRELTGEPFPGEVFHKKIRGFSFVGAHWGHEDESGPWIEAHAAEIDTEKLFIHVEHPHPYNTVYAEASGPQGVKEFLSSYPTCLSLSGHSHLSMNDDRALWRGAFTAMTGSVPSKHTALISVHPDRVVIARRDVKNGVDLPEWVLPIATAPRMRACSSTAISFDSRVRTASVVVQSTAFDSFDRRSEGSAAIRFSSIRPKQTLVVIR